MQLCINFPAVAVSEGKIGGRRSADIYIALNTPNRVCLVVERNESWFAGLDPAIAN